MVLHLLLDSQLDFVLPSGGPKLNTSSINLIIFTQILEKYLENINEGPHNKKNFQWVNNFNASYFFFEKRRR